MPPRKRKIEPPPLEDQIKNLSDEVLACRDIRHLWVSEVPFYRYSVKGAPRGMIHVYREIICTRCGTVRKESYIVGRNTLEKISSNYEYTKEYLLLGAKRKDRVFEKVRLEQIRRSVGDILSK